MSKAVLLGCFFYATTGGEITMANRIRGITVEIGGDTTRLSKAL